jgi:hypothetical protein
MASRVIVHAAEPGAMPAASVAQRLRSGGMKVLDQQEHMLLVEGGMTEVSGALGGSGWKVSEPKEVPRPRTRPEVLRKP